MATETKTIYPGEYCRLAVTATIEVAPGVSEILVPHDVEAVVSVWFKRSGEPVFVDQPMAYDEEHSVWLYDWDTTGVAPGKYLVRTKFTGAPPLAKWEYRDVTIAKDKAPVVE